MHMDYSVLNIYLSAFTLLLESLKPHYYFIISMLEERQIIYEMTIDIRLHVARK